MEAGARARGGCNGFCVCLCVCWFVVQSVSIREAVKQVRRLCAMHGDVLSAVSRKCLLFKCVPAEHVQACTRELSPILVRPYLATVSSMVRAAMGVRGQ
mgnify:CR=1 FL=1